MVIEGLWIVRFLIPDDSREDLNGGVVVIETSRLLGGDSGYFYIGDISQKSTGLWNVNLEINRHNPSIISIFGDFNNMSLVGSIKTNGIDVDGRQLLMATFLMATGPNLIVEMKKVSELP